MFNPKIPSNFYERIVHLENSLYRKPKKTETDELLLLYKLGAKFYEGLNHEISTEFQKKYYQLSFDFPKYTKNKKEDNLKTNCNIRMSKRLTNIISKENLRNKSILYTNHNEMLEFNKYKFSQEKLNEHSKKNSNIERKLLISEIIRKHEENFENCSEIIDRNLKEQRKKFLELKRFKYESSRKQIISKKIQSKSISHTNFITVLEKLNYLNSRKSTKINLANLLTIKLKEFKGKNKPIIFNEIFETYRSKFFSDFLRKKDFLVEESIKIIHINLKKRILNWIKCQDSINELNLIRGENDIEENFNIAMLKLIKCVNDDFEIKLKKIKSKLDSRIQELIEESKKSYSSERQTISSMFVEMFQEMIYFFINKLRSKI